MNRAGEREDGMTLNRFGYEWSTFREIDPLYEIQFKAWTAPIPTAEWKSKRVLDAGCGTGRNSLWPLKYGAVSVVAFDVDPRTVEVARTNLSGYPQCEVRQCSIYEIPWENEFDITFSIGVIHHLADPKKAVRQLIKATKRGGLILIWVYGREGQTIVKSVVNLIRRVTCRLPPALLNVLVRPVSLAAWAVLRLILFRQPYLSQFKRARYWHVHSIIFDQLLPEIANYWTREEAMALFEGCEVSDVRAEWVNGVSWTVWAKKR